MKIINNQEILSFIERCLQNLHDNRMNDFVGLKIDKANMIQTQRKMKKAGFPEFQCEENNFPNLYISTKTFLNTPYHQNIQLKQIKSAGFKFREETIDAHYLFNSDAILQDPNKELKDWMKLRALDEPYNAVVLRQKNEVWMMDVPSEAATIDPYAKKATGNVITFGLGIGYFIYMASLNKNVKSITVIEQSIDVIEMFKSDLLNQFPTHINIDIIHGDAFDYFNKETLSKFDYAFVDIWQSSDDGLLLIEELLSQYLPPFEKVDFWIESSCFELLYGIILLHFRFLATKKKPNLNTHASKIYKKVEKYFKTKNSTSTTVESLKDMMYDHQLIREILHQK